MGSAKRCELRVGFTVLDVFTESKLILVDMTIEQLARLRCSTSGVFIQQNQTNP
jgi:hypothetical protein